MKKNFTVNISGIIFHIDEDAYSVLKNYLESIKRYYVGSDGADDIYTDIEGRIAEMLQEKLSDKKQVITIKDIEEVTMIMGQPQEFESGEYFHEEEQNVSSSRPKRLFRDPDNKMIGGVCGGIGAYLNTDPLWFRLAFVLFTFIGGSGLLVYIILWLVIPEAKSTAEKLEMKGQQVNISTIEKKIKDEINHLEKKLNDLTDKAKEAYKKKSADHKSLIEKILAGFVRFMKLIFKIIIIALGVAFIMLGIGLLIPLVTPLLDLGGIHIFNFSFITHSELPAIKYLMLIFNSTHELSLALVGILLVVGIPVIMLIFVGIKLLFGLKSTKPIGITALIFWIVGVVICGLIALQTGRDFKHKATSRKETSHQFKTDRPLYLFAGSSKNFDDLTYYEDDFFFDEDHPFIMNKNNDVLIKSIALDLRKSSNETTNIILYASARGKNKHYARENSRKIIYNISETDTSIIFDPYFTLPHHEKWRDQAIQIVLEVPVGQEIYLHPELSTITNYHSYRHTSDRAGKNWKMTEEGLQPESSDDY